MTSLLAQSAAPVLKIIVPLGLVLAIAAILLMVLAMVRRRMRHDAMGPARDFSLGDLRSLHREGKLSDSEFERAKAKLVSGVRATLKREAKPSMVEEPFAEELKDA